VRSIRRVLAAVATFALEGVHPQEVTVEVDVRRGLPAFTLVGLPDRAIRESRERVRAALLNSELDFPQKRLTVNLAPAHVRKAGPSFDLAIAVGLLAASGQVPAEQLDSWALAGELSLSGELRPVRGALNAALGARRAGYQRLLVPEPNAPEAALVEGIEVSAIPSLTRLADLLHGRWAPEPARPAVPDPDEPAPEAPDLADVRGQEDAKRALEIAAAGGHNLLMVGPPGAGKTMLARRLPGILPPPSFEEALEITQVHSAAGLGNGRLAAERPFRAPHHTISAQGLVGGGSRPMPGEITLAHTRVREATLVSGDPYTSGEPARQLSGYAQHRSHNGCVSCAAGFVACVEHLRSQLHFRPPEGADVSGRTRSGRLAAHARGDASSQDRLVGLVRDDRSPPGHLVSRRLGHQSVGQPYTPGARSRGV
jgi:magnesium chelatase family protein